MRLIHTAIAITALLLAAAVPTLAQSRAEKDTLSQSKSGAGKTQYGTFSYVSASLGDRSDHYYSDPKETWWVRTNFDADGWATVQWGRYSNGRYWRIDYPAVCAAETSVPATKTAEDVTLE